MIDSKKILNIAKDVISIQSMSIKHLSKQINDDFSGVVEEVEVVEVHVKEGDSITIDANQHLIQLNVDDKEIINTVLPIVENHLKMKSK